MQRFCIISHKDKKSVNGLNGFFPLTIEMLPRLGEVVVKYAREVSMRLGYFQG